MTYNKKKICIFIILIAVVLIIFSVFLYLRMKEEKQVDPASAGLTDMKKIEILNQLNATAKTTVVNDTQKTKMLKGLNTGTVKSKSLTDSQKAAILNSLTNK